MFDTACIYFRFDIPCRQVGNCWAYNNYQLAWSILAAALIGIGANFIFSFLSWLCYPKQNASEEEPVTDEKFLLKESPKSAVEDVDALTAAKRSDFRLSGDEIIINPSIFTLTTNLDDEDDGEDSPEKTNPPEEELQSKSGPVEEQNDATNNIDYEEAPEEEINKPPEEEAEKLGEGRESESEAVGTASPVRTVEEESVPGEEAAFETTNIDDAVIPENETAEPPEGESNSAATSPPAEENASGEDGADGTPKPPEAELPESSPPAEENASGEDVADGTPKPPEAELPESEPGSVTDTDPLVAN